MDFNIEKGVAEPKTQPRAQSLAQGLVGHFSRIFKLKSLKPKNYMIKDQRKFTQSVVANKKSRKQFWAEPLTVSQLSRT